MNHPTDARLQDYADGLLEEGDVAAIQHHLRVCHACARVASDLEELKRAARELVVGEAPDAGAWSLIEGRIGRATAGERTAPPPSVRSIPNLTARRLSLAAAVVLALGVTAGSVLTVLIRGADTPRELVEQPTAGLENASRMVATQLEEAYGPSLVELQLILEQGQDQLDPETLEVVRANLSIIESAIHEALEALAGDPASTAVRRSLEQLYQAEVRLLKHAASLI